MEPVAKRYPLEVEFRWHPRRLEVSDLGALALVQRVELLEEGVSVQAVHLVRPVGVLPLAVAGAAVRVPEGVGSEELRTFPAAEGLLRRTLPVPEGLRCPPGFVSTGGCLDFCGYEKLKNRRDPSQTPDTKQLPQ